MNRKQNSYIYMVARRTRTGVLHELRDQQTIELVERQTQQTLQRRILEERSEKGCEYEGYNERLTPIVKFQCGSKKQIPLLLKCSVKGIGNKSNNLLNFL